MSIHSQVMRLFVTCHAFYHNTFWPRDIKSYSLLPWPMTIFPNLVDIQTSVKKLCHYVTNRQIDTHHFIVPPSNFIGWGTPNPVIRTAKAIHMTGEKRVGSGMRNMGFCERQILALQPSNVMLCD